MDKNTLLSDFSVAVFDLWDIYTSNVSTFQQTLFLEGLGSSEHRLDPLKKIRQNCLDHPSSLWMTVLQNSPSKVGGGGMDEGCTRCLERIIGTDRPCTSSNQHYFLTSNLCFKCHFCRDIASVADLCRAATEALSQFS